MDKETFLDLMDKYFKGSLTEKEKKYLEELIKNDIELEKEFISYKSIFEGIKFEGRRRLAEELTAIKNEVKLSERKRNILSMNWKWVISSAAVFIMVMVVIIIKNSFNTSKSDFYTGYNSVTILPKSGNLGGNSTKKYYICIIKSKAESYEIKNDTINIFIKQGMYKELKNKNLDFKIDGNRNLQTFADNKVFIFHLKNK